MKARYRVFGLFVLLAWLLSGCGGDDYYYPSVKLDFLTAESDASGCLARVVTDEGEVFPVLEVASSYTTSPDTLVRILCNYEPVDGVNAENGIKLYSPYNVIAPIPRPEEFFEEGIRTAPADVQAIWMGLDYLNVILQIKAQDAPHAFHFVEQKVLTDMASGLREVYLQLYHDDGQDVQAYTQRVYLSVPLLHYWEDGVRQLKVYFSLRDAFGEQHTYSFDYLPQ